MPESNVYYMYNPAGFASSPVNSFVPQNSPKPISINLLSPSVANIYPASTYANIVPSGSSDAKPRPALKTLFLSKLSMSLAIVGFLILAISYGPGLYYSAKSGIADNNTGYQLTSTEVDSLSMPAPKPRSTFMPAINPRLPKSNMLIIKTIGVKTEIQEATFDNYEAALKEGPWRVSNFGSPNDNSKPTILAAHRYGYLEWDNLFRRQHSFYNLTKLKVGDTVEINWMQRKYIYEVYAEGNGTEIADYDADLILYTCVDLEGPVRIFKYGRLLEI